MARTSPHPKTILVACAVITVACVGGVLLLRSPPASPPWSRLLNDVRSEPAVCTRWSVVSDGATAEARTWFDNEFGANCSAATTDRLSIPRILHHIYFPSKSAFEHQARRPGSSSSLSWSEGCLRMHANWHHVFWDEPAARRFLQKFWPDFLVVFEGYGHPVQRADSLRPLVLHTFGGMYMDLDIECFVPLDDMLQGADVVLQGTGEAEPVTNGIMASRPGVDLWSLAADELRARAGRSDLDIPQQTGPDVIASALRLVLGHDSVAPGLHRSARGGLAIRVWPLGSFVTPCQWNDGRCHRSLAIARAAGELPAGVVGYHRYGASWHARGRNRYGILTKSDVLRAIAGTQLLV